MLVVPYNFTPRPYQLEVLSKLDSGIKRAILRWPRRAGKDKMCFAYIAKEAFQHPGNYFYIFPTKEDARKALWENIDSKTGFRLLDHIPQELVIRKSNQEMLLEIKAGNFLGVDPTTKELLYSHTSTIRVVGYDKNPDSIRGTACKGVVLSEYAFSDPEVLRVLMPSIRQADGWLLIASTPNGRNHYYDLWESVQNSPDWVCSYKQTMWPDLPNYVQLDNIDFRQPDQLSKIMAEDGSTEEDVEREYGGSFNSGLKGSYYIDFIDNLREKGYISTYGYDETKRVTTYWDLGASDSNVCWFAQNMGNLTIFIDYYESVGESIDSLVRMLASKGYEYDYHYLPHDAGPDRLRRESNVSVEQDFVDALNDFKVNGIIQVAPKPPTKQHIITAVRKIFSLLRFDNFKCAEGLRHLELFHKSFNKKTKTYSDEPVHDEHSHAADALGLVPQSRNQSTPYTIASSYTVESKYDIWGNN